MIVFWIQGYTAGKGVCASARGDVFPHVEVQMEESCTIALAYVSGDVRIGDEAPAMVRTGGHHQCIPDRFLTKELLNEAVEHVPDEAHLWKAGHGAIMVKVHVKRGVDGSEYIGLIEICKYVGNDDGAISLPGVGCIRSRKPVKDDVRVDLEVRNGDGGIAVDHQMVWFRFRLPALARVGVPDLDGSIV
jgi:hypothetical protein